jgi:hypothetical protein
MGSNRHYVEERLAHPVSVVDVMLAAVREAVVRANGVTEREQREGRGREGCG